MKVILIAGTWYSSEAYIPIWGNFKREFLKRQPDARFGRTHAAFRLRETDKMRAFARHVREKSDADEEILLVGHSMGGIIACGVAPSLTQAKVRGIITIFSPHELGGFLPAFDYYRLLFGGMPKLNVPVVSFGGYIDPVVPFPFTRYPSAARHVNLFSDHRFILGYNREVARRIVEEAADILSL